VNTPATLQQSRGLTRLEGEKDKEKMPHQHHQASHGAQAHQGVEEMTTTTTL
jgi:hypothetical protein